MWLPKQQDKQGSTTLKVENNLIMGLNTNVLLKISSKSENKRIEVKPTWSTKSSEEKKTAVRDLLFCYCCSKRRFQNGKESTEKGGTGNNGGLLN